MSEANLNPVTPRSESSLSVGQRVIELGQRQTGHPLAMYFVYSPKGNFLVKGNADLVRDYVDKEFPVCIYRYTYWKSNQSRGDWSGNGLYVFDLQEIRKQDYHYRKIKFGELYPPQREMLKNAPHSAKHAIVSRKIVGSRVFYYRQMPKKWLPEWNELLEKQFPTEKPRLNNSFFH